MELFHGPCDNCGNTVHRLEHFCAHCGGVVFYEFRAFRNILLFLGASILLLVGVFWWLFSPSGRIAAFVNLPLKLSQGASVEKKFTVAVDAPYLVRLVFDKRVRVEDLDCILGGQGDTPCAKSGERLSFAWSVLSGDRALLDSGSGQAYTDSYGPGKSCYAQDSFDGNAGGTYTLRFKVLRASRSPKLRLGHLEVLCGSTLWDSLVTVFTSELLILVWATLLLWGLAALLWLRQWRYAPKPTLPEVKP